MANVRRSYLEYDNAILIGYRVTASYEYLVSKHFLVGIRMDFDSYTNGDINTLLAGKIGYSFKKEFEKYYERNSRKKHPLSSIIYKIIINSLPLRLQTPMFRRPPQCR